ncbi:MAG: hypothetical protein ACT4QE_10790 [Anaerolineales bacterium]
MIADEAALSDLLTAAIERLQTEMKAATPSLAEPVAAWMLTLAATPQPEDYFKNPIGFPLLLLPWWLESTIHPEPALAFQSTLVYSTVNGYYYIRLLDNVMDGHMTVELKLLPAAGFFHTQFQSAYQPFFDAAHPFWKHFTQTWFHSAEVTARDAGLSALSRAEFQRYASQKVCAVKIPLAAVCYRYRRLDLLEPWSRFVDAFGAWHQWWNDVFDWSKDLRHGTGTYVLSEAERRKRLDESVAAWVVREGFDWGIAALHEWMAEARTLAGPLNSPDLMMYLGRREAMLEQQRIEVAEGLRRLAKLSAVMT